ncbi:MAG: transglutaminase domain-containing protein [Myxococcales bacterium]|nr:transglutaminase domain-containing protein [Myxococcales bacterium]MCB9522613.1 transglutaminase domain-containing protein [Myxococcales bacterium]
MTRWDLIGLACVLAFGAALTHHLTGGPRGPAPMSDPAAQGPGVALGSEWMGLHFKGERVGLMHLEKTARAQGGGYRYALRTNLRFTALGRAQRIDLQVDADLDAALTLEAFDFALGAGPARLTGHGHVEGRAIELSLDTGGQTATRRIDLAHPPVLRANLGPVLSQQTLAVGKQFVFHTFDPLTQRDQRVEITVLGRGPLAVMGREVQAWRLEQRVGGLVLEGWINDRGEMLRQELGMGLVAVRETETEARWGLTEARAGRAAPDLMRATLIEVPGLPPSLAGRARLTLQVAGLDLAPFKVDDRRQALGGDTLVITREPVGAGLPLPVRPAPEGSLAAEPLIQVGHPAIQAAARGAAGDAPDSVAVARRLVAWMQRTLTQQLVPGVPSALETLQTKVGDCNEHATLFAALARSLGVPTRIAVGLVYKDGVFGYHAWNEVLTGDGWLSVDPTWGQIPADVGHLRLVYGGLDQQVALLGAFGRLKLTVRE